jgi:hypothetical protein
MIVDELRTMTINVINGCQFDFFNFESVRKIIMITIMRKMCKKIFVALIFVIVLPTACFAKASFGNGDSLFGVNYHFRLNAASDAQELAVSQALGIHFARMDVLWKNIEREPGKYDFNRYDILLRQLAEHNIRPMLILDYGNKLYGDEHAIRNPEERAAFARFAAVAAARYKGRGVIWEIWNEPDSGRFWSPAPNVNEYVAMAIDCASAIRSADPDAVIIGPAVSWMNLPFLESAFKLGLLKYIDAVSVHPYRVNNPETVTAEYQKLRGLIEKYQPTPTKIPIIASEWGYSATSLDHDERLQANYAARIILTNAMNGIPVTILYDLRNVGRNPNDKESNFGVMTNNLQPKAAYYTISELSQALAGKYFVIRLASDANDYLLVFSDGSEMGNVLVSWTTAGDHGKKLSEKINLNLTGKPTYTPFDKSEL